VRVEDLKVGLLLELRRVGQPAAAPLTFYQEFELEPMEGGIEIEGDGINR
jgi:hypothetical protein